MVTYPHPPSQLIPMLSLSFHHWHIHVLCLDPVPIWFLASPFPILHGNYHRQHTTYLQVLFTCTPSSLTKKGNWQMLTFHWTSLAGKTEWQRYFNFSAGTQMIYGFTDRRAVNCDGWSSLYLAIEELGKTTILGHSSSEPETWHYSCLWPGVWGASLVAEPVVTVMDNENTIWESQSSRLSNTETDMARLLKFAMVS